MPDKLPDRRSCRVEPKERMMKMKRKGKLWKLLAAGMAAMLLFAGCGSGGGSYDNASVSSSASVETGEAAMDTLAANGLETGTVDPETMENAGRKIIYTAYAAMETETFDETSASVRQMVEEAGGYISSSSARGSRTDGTRSVDYTCKIPAGNYAGFIDGLSGAGNLYRLTESTDDVTLQYVDLDARLSSLQNQLDRLEELAAEASDIETLLTIETQIGEVQYELESYTAQMRTLENQISYSTVDLTIDEVASVSEGTGFGTRVKAAFGGSWDNFVAAVQGIIIALIYLLPGLIVLGVVLAAVIPLAVCHSRETKARAASKSPGQFSGWNQPSPPVPEEPKPAPPQDEQEKG